LYAYQLDCAKGLHEYVFPQPDTPKLADGYGRRPFRIQSEDGYTPHGELMVFELDDQGKASRARIGDDYTFPVETW
jgi:hypothetical protein